LRYHRPEFKKDPAGWVSTLEQVPFGGKLKVHLGQLRFYAAANRFWNAPMHTADFVIDPHREFSLAVARPEEWGTSPGPKRKNQPEDIVRVIPPRGSGQRRNITKARILCAPHVSVGSPSEPRGPSTACHSAGITPEPSRP
jgi:hypothetical protein